jgi:predicted signal transduction protein with EAL and GGDEF domain
MEEKMLSGMGRRIIDRLEIPIPFNAENCRISSSIGVALSTAYTDLTADQILDDADIALYASKRAGRARLSFYSDEMRIEQDA